MSALAVKYLTGCIYQEVILGIQLRCLKVAIFVLGTEDVNLSQSSKSLLMFAAFRIESALPE